VLVLTSSEVKLLQQQRKSVIETDGFEGDSEPDNLPDVPLELVREVTSQPRKPKRPIKTISLL